MWKRWWWAVPEGLRGNARSRVQWTSLGFLGLLIVGWLTAATDAVAIGRLMYRNSEDAALGISGSSYALIYGLTGDRSVVPCWCVEAGEHRLFSVDGLKTDAVSLMIRPGRWGAVVSATHLSTPVGSEGVLGVESVYVGNRSFSFAAGLRVDRLTLPGFGEAYLAVVSVRMFAHLGSGLIVGYTADTIRVAGEDHPGAGLACHVIVSPVSPVCLLSRLEISRSGTPSTGIAASVRTGRRLRVAAGYDGASGGLAGAVTCTVGRIGLRAGADLHPVLGVSKSVFVFWGGGS